jgi:hypothetical protein
VVTFYNAKNARHITTKTRVMLITFADKVSGNQLSAAEVNELKGAHNDLFDVDSKIKDEHLKGVDFPADSWEKTIVGGILTLRPKVSHETVTNFSEIDPADTSRRTIDVTSTNTLYFHPGYGTQLYVLSTTKVSIIST